MEYAEGPRVGRRVAWTQELANEDTAFVKGVVVMPVFNYTARRENPKLFIESGTIVAQDERQAVNFLKQEFHDIRLRQLRGLRSLWMRLNADIS